MPSCCPDFIQVRHFINSFCFISNIIFLRAISWEVLLISVLSVEPNTVYYNSSNLTNSSILLRIRNGDAGQSRLVKRIRQP